MLWIHKYNICQGPGALGFLRGNLKRPNPKLFSAPSKLWFEATYTHTHTHIYIYIYTHVYIYIYVYVHILERGNPER